MPSIRILYIGGVGRSGSTVLSTLLGNHPSIESVGELTNLPRRGWINNEYCACGERCSICSFWSKVRAEWVKSIGFDDIERYLALQNTFESMNFQSMKSFLCWLRLFRERMNGSPQFQAYSEWTCALFQTICSVSKKSIIVDSSKNPVRALALSMMPEIDVYLIHLVRDGRGVAHSLKKAYKQHQKGGIEETLQAWPVWKTAIFWSDVNLQSELLRSQFDPGKSIRVLYEDFATNPKKTLERIGHLIECDFDEVANAVTAGEAMKVGHAIAGNRLRMRGTVQLQADTEWIDRLPVQEQNLFWLLAGWLMQQYGYKT
ncbi:sulfotransferase [Trichocoleus sp. DQ-A3]|uniref:sulfotransferase n=1 Tax=Cyanophyceae TaxID=3028117 RepID=UPI001684A966|nr:sulfotransferase [Coleofasciculus sp. FACHB-125]MBD1903539.1 sulfotransferase [Coleofasciculus sp. FACHB-125]